MQLQRRPIKCISCTHIAEFIQRSHYVFVALMPVRVRQPNKDIQKIGSEAEPKAKVQPNLNIDLVVFAIRIFKHAQRESASASPCDPGLPQKLVLGDSIGKHVENQLQPRIGYHGQNRITAAANR